MRKRAFWRAPIWAVALLAATATAAHGQERQAFRVVRLEVIDPHFYFDPFGTGVCHDITNPPGLLGSSLNGLTQQSLEQCDPVGGGSVPRCTHDFNLLAIFDPLNRTTGQGGALADCTYGGDPCEATVGFDDECTRCAGGVNCSGVLTDAAATTYGVAGAGHICLNAYAGTTGPNNGGSYTPAIVPTDGPCAVSGAVALPLPLGTNFVTLPLQHLQLAGQFVGDPATGLTKGLMRGFVSETAADATMVNFEVLASVPLSALLAGGQNSCAPSGGTNNNQDDRDTHPPDNLGGELGWWFYIAFEAEAVVVAEPAAVCASCGDGVVEGPEACDDGNSANGDGCDANCTVSGCGNGVVVIGEACDDGNTIDGDGCDSNCTISDCGNGVAANGEQCDDDNGVDGDGCDSNCTITACGNGVVTGGEECDDGNVVDGDGCNADCRVGTIEDLDGDLVRDDGDGSGIAGDNQCANGQTTNCDDNCRYNSNSTQADADGDGVGDTCDYNCRAGTGGAVAISGKVYRDAIAPANVLVDAYVTACGLGCCEWVESANDGSYAFRSLVPGSYTITASPASNDLSGSQIGPVIVNGSDAVDDQDIVLYSLRPLPAGVDLLTCDGAPVPTDGTNGVPIVPPGCLKLLVNECAAQCEEGATIYRIGRIDGTIVASGLVNPSLDGTCVATIDPWPSDAALIVVDRICDPTGPVPPGPCTCEEFPDLSDCPLENLVQTPIGSRPCDTKPPSPVWIDPSGTVNFVTGAAAPGAEVVLLRSVSESPEGPFEPVPDGSAVMSPQNRKNPDLVDGEGRYGWDVIAGFYQVRARLSGCTASSPVLTIPPAVTELAIPLECLCTAGPMAGCQSLAAGRSSLLLKDSGKPTSRSLKWKWKALKGEGVAADLGDPSQSDSFAVCVYGGSSQLVAQADAPAAGTCATQDCWKPGAKGFQYRDKERTPNGMDSLRLLRQSDSASLVGSLSVKGAGSNLDLSALSSATLPVRVQLQRSGPSSGSCWETTYSGAVIQSPGKLTAKHP